jgi:hypothetical protein
MVGAAIVIIIMLLVFLLVILPAILSIKTWGVQNGRSECLFQCYHNFFNDTHRNVDTLSNIIPS